MNKRIELLRKYISDKGLDAVIVTNESNVRYFSDFTGEGHLIISPSSLVLCTDFRYTEQAKIQSPGFEIADIAKVKQSDVLAEFKTVGFENKTISYDVFGVFSKCVDKTVNLDFALTDMRAVKDGDEIECIKAAEHIGDMAFEHILKFIKPGVSERDIALELEFFMRKSGAEAMSFLPIAAAGAHGSMPHAEPGDYKVKNGDFIVMDFGCKYKGYCSDMTRTVCVGKATDEQKKVYNTVLKAQTESLAMLCAGANPSEVHRLAQRIIDADYPGTFGHALGHGVGLDIHERPVLSPKNSVPLVRSNVVTVEPGIYLAGKFGVRIEDVAVICDENIINLTNSDKNLIEL